MRGSSDPLTVEVAVVGRGPTGVFAASRLTDAGAHVALVGAPRPAALAPMPAGEERITVVPILPLLRSGSFPPYRDVAPLSIRFTGDPESLVRPRFAAGSLAERQWNNPAGLVLSEKQYGSALWMSPLVEVQSKIDRAYVGHRSAPRSGYLSDGTSPYWPTFKEALAELETIESDIVKWDRPRRRLVLESGDTVAYERAVVTIPLERAAGLLGLHVAVPETRPAAFTVVRTAGHSAQQMVYDLEPRSPVFRVLTPTSHAAVVQRSLVSEDDGNSRNWRVADAVESLIETEVLDITIANHTQRLAYPVEPLADEALSVLADLRDGDGVLLFGRYATHRYVDLNELPWDELTR